MIIMSSDGVVENLIDNDLLEEFISNAKDLAPQQIVYEILNYKMCIRDRYLIMLR